MSTHRTRTVTVDGGELTVGEWGDPGALPLIAIHGITSSHLAWAHVAAALPERRVIAPDLRGRGRSNELPGPYGMPRHAADLLRLLDDLGLERAQLTGHSMGAFVAAATAALAPDRVSSVVLVDGGLPLRDPPGGDVEAAVRASLGPALERLSMTFADSAAYRAFWAAHPAFGGEFDAEMLAYIDYDLVGDPPHPSSKADAVAQDSVQFYGDPPAQTIDAIRAPMRLLWAPRGLLNETPGMYTGTELARWRERWPAIAMREVDDVNHYTILMSARGAAEVAAEVRQAG
ncbi:alpha/beta fold hydrolase [Pseudolysinimonas kribbensis]|uniref:alpha/beta fold hydrolase n=1 Tax=Pseudolysinimonas kribbensis TaxID=433641 RepID=UPI0024E16165|nr:alpha/beta fold hydrolase [Pseudolysinimonas kribbensis]